MSYFAFNCCDCVSPSDPLKAADRTKRWECLFTMHCEFYWLQIKIKNQLSISLDSVTFSNNNWSMQYESAGVSENRQRLACILLGKWIDKCVNTKISPVVVRRYERATFLMTQHRSQGADSPNNTWTFHIWDTFSTHVQCITYFWKQSHAQVCNLLMGVYSRCSWFGPSDISMVGKLFLRGANRLFLSGAAWLVPG